MPASLSKSLRCLSSPLTKMDEEVTAVLKITGNKQGIVSILGSDCETNKTTASLRRTLSADMSSKKWLEQQGFSPMKRIASVAELPMASVADSSSSSSDGEEEDFEARRRQLQIWGSIQEEEEKKTELENPGQFDIWTSILSQKAEQEDSSKNDSNDPAAAPYIHPLVKRSSSSLSEKSLEICTESLGSETGSDGFSSYPPSEIVELDPEELEQQEEQEEQQQEKEELRIAKYSKKAPPRSFPPPLPSLSRGDGPSLRMQSHRNNGRLVLEAVSVPTQNYFSAQRQDGRLLLTFVNSPNTAEDQPKEDCQETVEDDKEEMEEWSDGEELGECDKDEEEEAIEDEYEEDDEVAEIEEVENFGKESIISKVEMEIGMEQQPAPKVVKTEVINVHRAAVMMNKLIRLANRNPTWPKRINEVIKFEDEEEQFEPTPLSKSFPVPPRTVPRLIPSSPTAATAASFNVYENCWRNKQPTTIFSSPPLQKPPPLKNYNNNNNNNKFIFSKTTLKANDQQQQLLVLRGDNKGDYSLHMIKGCKDPRRSLLFWEPHCIATS